MRASSGNLAHFNTYHSTCSAQISMISVTFLHRDTACTPLNFTSQPATGRSKIYLHTMLNNVKRTRIRAPCGDCIVWHSHSAVQQLSLITHLREWLHRRKRRPPLSAIRVTEQHLISGSAIFHALLQPLPEGARSSWTRPLAYRDDTMATQCTTVSTVSTPAK
jgi:hypothetical protein